MDYIVDQKIQVTDSVDGKKYACKIVDIKSDTNEIKIHFINWKDRYDEWLSADSNRC